MSNAKRDENRIPTIIGVSNVDLATPTLVRVNPTTGALITEGGVSTFSRSATKVVAASDSLDTTNVDYLCDGTADDVQIQVAIDALPATGGRVILLEGTYTLATKLTIVKSGVTLQGQGKGTVVTLVNAANTDILYLGDDVSTKYRITIKDIYFDGNQANQGATSYIINNYDASNPIQQVLITGCYFVNARDGAFKSWEDYQVIDDCFFENWKDGSSAVYFESISILNNCNFVTTNTTGPFVNDQGGVSQVSSCRFTVPASYNDYVIYGCSLVTDCIISCGNNLGAAFEGVTGVTQCIGNNISAGTGCNVAGMMIASCTVVIGNALFRGGIGIYSRGQNCIFADNSISTMKAEAIKINTYASKSWITVNNNRIIAPGVATNNTYAGILLTGTSTYCTIIGNTITSEDANKHSYGIREASTADGPNIITNNICLNAVTAQISTQHASTDVSHNITA